MRALLLMVLLVPACSTETQVIECEPENTSPQLKIDVQPQVEEMAEKLAEEPSSIEPQKVVRSWSHLQSRSKSSRVGDSERDVLMSVGEDFDVPAKLLYGIWCVESARLKNGWHHRWQLARLLPQYGSLCARRYGIVKCRANWAALQRICAQERDGEPICDPNRVRTSRAIALGPTQHLAIKWSPAEGEWATYAYDYDHDGTYDPHSFADAVASSAGHLRHDFEMARDEQHMSDENAWRHAVRMYLGKATARRYERKVYRYARNWCAVPGYCE